MTAPGTSGGVRRRSREMALQMLFQTEFSQQGPASDRAAILKRFVGDFAVESDVADYGGRLFLGVSDKCQEIDGIIQSCSAHWKVSRMGLVDVSVMRIAVFEMRFLEPRLSPKIAIDEAIELAKRFGSTESGAFVNGILDQVAKVER